MAFFLEDWRVSEILLGILILMIWNTVSASLLKGVDEETVRENVDWSMLQELDVERKGNELQTIHAKILKDMEEAYCKKIMVEISRF